jgi:hypothetical protein
MRPFYFDFISKIKIVKIYFFYFEKILETFGKKKLSKNLYIYEQLKITFKI